MEQISRTDLARRTREIMEQARKGRPALVASYGQEQVIVVDALDFRLLTAAATIKRRSDAPSELKEEELAAAEAAAGGDRQARVNLIMSTYLDGGMRLGRTAELLGVSRFDLIDRFDRLGLPLRLGSMTQVEALAGLEGLGS